MNYIAYLSEFIGSIIFIGSIKATSGQPVLIGIGLALAVFLTASYSGGNLNPAVSIMNYAIGNLNLTDTAMYSLSQILGALFVGMYIPKLI
jgi:glycerol uptake facilitator-like aquaporin